MNMISLPRIDGAGGDYYFGTHVNSRSLYTCSGFQRHAYKSSVNQQHSGTSGRDVLPGRASTEIEAVHPSLLRGPVGAHLGTCYRLDCGQPFS
ncbi:unnamed protein product [Ectocarpus sp. 13 AM-2016]